MKHDHYEADSFNNPKGLDNSFDNFLAKQLQESQPYISDNDFTANVVNKLPTAKKLSVWQERLIIFIPFLMISLLVLSQFSILNVLVSFWSFLVATQIATWLQLGLITTLTVVIGASCWFAKQFKLI
jgi:hypothetical protein